MKSFLIISLIFTLVLQLVKCEMDAVDYFDLNDADQHVQVVQLIFSKLNKVLKDTAEINIRLDAAEKKFYQMDQNVAKISRDIANAKAETTKCVEEQASLVQISLVKNENFTKRSDDFERRINGMANELAVLKNDMSVTLPDRNDAFEKEMNAKMVEITNLLRKSTKDIKTFKTEITRTVEDQSVNLRRKINETLQHQGRQQNEIRLLWDHGSLKAQTEWNVILRRLDGSVDFNRNWTEYKYGFGDPTGEFFVGLEVLHRMTTNGYKHEIRIDFKDSDNKQTYAEYDNLVIGSEQEKYVLKDVGAHSGNAEDALAHHMGENFTTYDQDNDMAEGENCAETFKGPWWFYQCYPNSNLFGPYHYHPLGHRMRWGPSILKNLKFVEVKIRQVQ